MRQDAGEKACGKMRGGSMELKGCNAEYWCEGDYWNGKYFLENALLSEGRDNKIPKTTHSKIRAGGERQRVGIEA